MDPVTIGMMALKFLPVALSAYGAMQGGGGQPQNVNQTVQQGPGSGPAPTPFAMGMPTPPSGVPLGLLPMMMQRGMR